MLLLNIDSSGWREITLASQVRLEVEGGEEGEVLEIYSFNYLWSTLPEDNGKHFYVVKAIDNFGNEEVISREVIIENIVIVKKEEPDYIGMINKMLPLIVFITAVVLIILILLLFYRGTLQRWQKQAERKAGTHRIPRKKLGETDMDSRPRAKKQKRSDFKKRYDDDDDYDDYDDDEDDYDDDFVPPPQRVRKKETPRSRTSGKRTVKGRETPRARKKVGSRPVRAPKKKEGFDESYSYMKDDDGIDWD
jgi:hypothetical protein